MWLRRRSVYRLERGTQGLAVLALGTVAGVVVTEFGHVLRRGTPREAGDVAVVGYRESPARENALLNLFLSFVLTFGAARLSSTVIRRRGRFGPFRDLRVGSRHVHHFVPGIAMAFLAGGASVASRDETLDALLAVPFGAGVGLTLDESALLLGLEDVYWTEEGVLSVQIGLTAVAVLGSGILLARLRRRGEAEVLEA